MAWTVTWQVFVGGVDRTAGMRNYLVSLSAVDKEGLESDSCALVFDDTDGQLRLPAIGDPLGISVNGATVFAGVVSDVKSRGSRGGGRALTVNGKGFDDRGKIKEPQRFHLDDASLEDFLGKAGQNAGLSSVSVDPDLAEIRRDYWAADTESFLHLGQRLARELHATFKIRQGQAVLVPRGKELGLPGVVGTVGNGGNVVSWSISPRRGRADFTEIEARYFDPDTGTIKTETGSLSNDRGIPDAVNRIRAPAADQDQAKETIEARKRAADDDAGTGSVTLDITPAAQAEASFVLTGARAGVDGVYRIAGRTHQASRGAGSKTMLELKRPGDGAGSDSR